MRYLIVVPDGAGDDPIKALGDKTPLEVADIPFINSLAAKGQVGMVKTVPDGIAPGSDAANLSVMGFDPTKYLTGRSPLEAASIGVEMVEGDVAFRTNLVTLGGQGAYETLEMIDHSAGDISTEEATILIEAVKEAFSTEDTTFFPGVSYRHCMLTHHGKISQDLTPPHDILGKKIGDYLPKGEGSDYIKAMMEASYDLLKDHPVNQKRMEQGKNPANTIWIWGQGTKPQLPTFHEKYGLSGSVISAVDLIKGIGACAQLESIEVEGATGTLHTNFQGKAQAAVDAFRRGKDFVYVHLEGPDECSHQGDREGKISCMHDIDQKVVKTICQALDDDGEPYRVLIVPDHRTPLAIRTHSSDPVPYVLFDSRKSEQRNEEQGFFEKSGEMGRYFSDGYALADYFFEQ